MKTESCLIVLMLLLSSCAGKSWVIRHDENGGTIGYSGFSSSEDAKDSIRKLIHCERFQMLSDELHSAQSIAYMPLPASDTINGTITDSYGRTTSYQGTTNGTNYTPIRIDNSYRIFSYRCSPNWANASYSNVLFNNSNLKEEKIGRVNIQQVLLECKRGKEGQDKLKSIFNSEKEKLKLEEDKIKNLQREIENGKNLTSQNKEEKQLVINTLVENLSVLRNQKQEILQKLETQIKISILEAIKLSVDEIGYSQKYSLIEESEKKDDSLTKEIIQLVDSKI